MATYDIYKNLLGYDPREQQLQQQKLWAGLYGQAASPYERMGLALGQLGGTLFGGDTQEQGQLGTINKVLKEVSTQYSPNTPEYFKAIAEALPADMVNAKAFALQEAQKLEDVDTKKTRETVDYLSKHPDQLASELQYYTQRLEAKARTLGWNPQEPLSQEVSAEIQAKLEKTPEYKKIMQLSNAGQQAIVDKAQKEEKENLNIDLTKLNITKAKQDIADANKSPEAADRLLREVYKLDPEKPIPQQIAADPALSNLQYVPGFVTGLMQTQKKALEKKKTGVIVLK